MYDPSISGRCPHCGRSPGIREALAAISAILHTLPVAQVLRGWRLVAVTTYVAGLILVDHGASLLRVSRYLPGASHDQLSRLLGHRDLPALLMAALLQFLRQAPSQTTGEVQEGLIRTIWGHTTQFSAPVSDLSGDGVHRRQPNAASYFCE